MKPKLSIRLLKILQVTSIAIAIGVALIWLILQGYSAPWTGFGEYTRPDGEFVRGKTLWDWMQLFLVSLTLSVGLFFLNRAEREIERQRTEDRVKLEREIALDRQQEVALQAYFDKISDLLLKEKLLTTDAKEVRNMARTRTLTVLRGLDANRKGLVVRFLHEAGLLSKEKRIVDLYDADLTGANLDFAKLINVNLSDANLSNASLWFADLSGANLSNANLDDAKLKSATLNDANLSGARLSNAKCKSVQLENADLLGANLSQAVLRQAKLKSANLSDAHLSDTDMKFADLSGSNLSHADLRGADLSFSEMKHVDLTGALLDEIKVDIDMVNRVNDELQRLENKVEWTPLDQRGANLTSADMSDANLSDARVTKEQLAKAKSLKGAIMPDGTKHD